MEAEVDHVADFRRRVVEVSEGDRDDEDEGADDWGQRVHEDEEHQAAVQGVFHLEKRLHFDRIKKYDVVVPLNWMS